MTKYGIFHRREYMDNPENWYHARYHRIVNRWLIFSVVIISLIANFANNGLVEGAWMVLRTLGGACVGVVAGAFAALVLFLLGNAYKQLTYWLAGD